MPDNKSWIKRLTHRVPLFNLDRFYEFILSFPAAVVVDELSTHFFAPINQEPRFCGKYFFVFIAAVIAVCCLTMLTSHTTVIFCCTSNSAVELERSTVLLHCHIQSPWTNILGDTCLKWWIKGLCATSN